MNFLAMLLVTLGAFSESELRADDKYTAILQKQLDYVKTKTYDVVYPELKARSLIPASNEGDPGAETITYTSWDAFGMAQIISNFADDIPMVEVLAEELSQRVHSIALGYQYSIQDLRRAAMSGVPLTSKKAKTTRRQMEQKIEDIAAIGEANAGLTGIANNANVSLVSPVTGTWSTATGAQIVEDLLKLVSETVIRCKETFIPTTIVLDIASYNYAATRRISTTGDTHTTALQAFKASSPYPIEVVAWNKLALADAAGTGPRALCYPKTEDVLFLEITQEFEQMAPQQKNLAFVVPTHQRTAGVIMPYPVAVSYMDGL